MRGTDLSQWQLDAAEKFIRGRNKTIVGPFAPETITVRWSDLVRLVAWYGAIRADATKRGIDPDTPGEAYEVYQ